VHGRYASLTGAQHDQTKINSQSAPLGNIPGGARPARTRRLLARQSRVGACAHARARARHPAAALPGAAQPAVRGRGVRSDRRRQALPSLAGSHALKRLVRCVAWATVLDASAQVLLLTEMFRGMSLTLKYFFEPKVTVRAAATQQRRGAGLHARATCKPERGGSTCAPLARAPR
jgi:hypothetical protein